MKRLALLAASAAAFFFIANPVFVKYEQRQLVSSRGPFATAQKVNGIWAVPLQDFVKLAGGGLTLEPNFTLQGNRLMANLVANASADKHKVQGTPQENVSLNYSKVEVEYKPQKADGASAAGGGGGSGKAFIRKAGLVSSRVFMANGQAWIPVEDVARAFGGNLTQSASSLNFTVNGDGILAIR